MSYKRYITALLTCTLLLQCAPRPRITYNLPPHLNDENKKTLMTSLDRGKRLFKTYCADCHGIFSSGRDSIPNFTNMQLDNYSARFQRRDPTNHGVMNKMSSQQMNDVLAFLRFKKPSNPDSAAVTKKKMGPFQQ